MSYLNKTKDGYEVAALYMYKVTGNGTLLALIKRKNDWMWAWSYNPKNGTWGQGHYMFDSKADALADLKSEYRTAKPVLKTSIVQINTDDGDTFGWYETKDIALERAYHIAKARTRHTNESYELYKPGYNAIIGRVWVLGNKIAYTSGKETYRLYADGKIKKFKS